MVMNNRLSVGSLMAMTEYLLLLSWPTFALGWVTTLYQRGQAGLKRVFEVLHAPIEAEPALSDVSNGVFLPIVARNIFSAYGNTEVLQDISFTLEKGKMLAIVGPIGSGKTSLLFTLAQLLTISQGKLLAGEHLLTNIPKAEWWRQCALVPQKPLLFSATLRDNITFGVSHITDLELLNILEQVQLTKDIQALPEGLDTRVGEMGINLSGGQKVRVALARALLRKPRILLLDDVIAALDTEVALALQRALLAAHGETTLIMTSHRLQSVVHADEILVLREGRVVQQGNHKALMLEDGWYRDIFQMQSAREDSRPC
jgi:ATP-binding cassette subfamily B protein